MFLDQLELQHWSGGEGGREERWVRDKFIDFASSYHATQLSAFLVILFSSE